MERLLGRRERPDGAAPTLERQALAAPDTPEPDTPEPAAAAGRRDRALGTGEDALVEAVGTKVLHGWLQNRHQTLYPLTVNLRTLRAGEADALARWMAVAAHAGSGAPRDDLRPWLEKAGAAPETLAALAQALAGPPALHDALAEVSRGGLAAYAYVAAIVALPPHDQATAPFLAYVSTRLALPPDVVRSADRRYRR